jgi:hypothetical protein
VTADGFSDELRRLLPDPAKPDPLALGLGAAEELLAGRPGPAEAPAAYARVAQVLAAAAGPAALEELAGAAPALAAFRAAHPPTPTHRPTAASRPAHALRLAPARRPARRLRTRLAVLAIAAALPAGGVAAAATGTLPEPVTRLAGAVRHPAAGSHQRVGGPGPGGSTAATSRTAPARTAQGGAGGASRTAAVQTPGEEHGHDRGGGAKNGGSGGSGKGDGGKDKAGKDVGGGDPHGKDH